MRPLQGLVWSCALAALAAGTSANAGWNNVFQVCCNHCGGSPAPVVASYGDPCCPQPCPQPCPQTTCTTRYIQRTYYQPVTSYVQRTYYQPVTTYRTSYYYEPVCSYRYSCYFDPCTCRYQCCCTPVTSYRLRSRCCPVTSYLQRCCMTPVTTYRAACYYEPVTTCCTTTTGAPVASLPPGAAVTPAPPSNGVPAPRADETRTPPAGTESLPPPPPETSESHGSTAFQPPRSPAVQPPKVMPHVQDSSFRTPARPPVVRFDRIASRSGHNLEGRILDANQKPRASARILFVSVERKSLQRTATAERDGSFSAHLSAGGWLVYTYDGNGRPVFARRVEVPAGRSVQVTLVNR
jgi:hypothetical protein